MNSHAVTPLLARLHLSGLAGDPNEIAEALLIAIAQIAVIGLIFRPLESLAPAEKWAGRRYTRIDRTYTLVMLLGLNPLFAYLVLRRSRTGSVAAWLRWATPRAAASRIGCRGSVSIRSRCSSSTT
jgi:hypothetical protein